MGNRARAAVMLAGLVAAPVLAAGAAQAAAPEPGTQQGGTISQTGWWNSLNEPPPDNPLTPPPPPPAPDAPQGTLPVTVLSGEPRRISALEFALDGKPGATVDSVVLTLKESKQQSLSANADGAVIRACAVTEMFWVGGENNPWKNRPEHDCEAGSAPGVRDAKTGIWSFDLTGLAADWKAEDFLGSPSVVLAGAAEGKNGEPLSFQVVFDGVKAQGVGLAASTTAPTGSSGGGSEAGFGAGDAPAPGAGGAGGAGGDEGFGTTATGTAGGDLGDLGGGGDVSDLGAGDLGTDEAALAAPDAAGPIPEAAAEAEQIASVAAVQLPWHDGLGKPAVLLMPLMLGLAYLAMLAMGPDAQPTGVANRRGVSRALDKLRLAHAGIASKVGR